MRESIRTQTRSTRKRRAARASARTSCRCAGACHCGALIPRVVLRRLEQESEFYRRVM